LTDYNRIRCCCRHSVAVQRHNVR